MRRPDLAKKGSEELEMLGAVVLSAKKKAPIAAALRVQCGICMIESISHLSLSPTAVPDTGQSSDQASL